MCCVRLQHSVEVQRGLEDLCDSDAIDDDDDSDSDDEVIMKAVVSDGLLCSMERGAPDEVDWRRKFEAPIVHAWRIRDSFQCCCCIHFSDVTFHDSVLCSEFPIPSFIEICRLSFREFPRLVGRYCSYLLPKQGRGTPKTKHDKISRTMGWETLQFFSSF